MVETIDADAASGFKNVAHSTLIATEAAGMGAARSFTESVVKTAGEGIAIAGGALITAGITQWEYTNQRDNIRRQYEVELAAQTGKHYNDVTNKDLDNLGRKNIVVADALKRARWKRNLGLVIGTLAVAAAFVTGAWAAGVVASSLGVALTAAGTLPPVLSTLGGLFAGTATAAQAAGVVTTAITAGLASVAAFMGTEKISESIAHKYFGDKEPSIRKVTRNPGLQEKLSLSSQVSYLEHLQKRVDPQKPNTFISQEQVFTAILAAQPDMAQNIQNTYGKKFSALAPEQRAQVLADINKSINVEQITADLNNGRTRAQEMAFIMQGEASGVPRRDDSRVKAMQQEHRGIKHELDVAKAELHALRQHMKVTDTKLCKIQHAKDVDRNDAPTLSAIGPAQQRILAERQANAAKGAAIGA